MNKKSLYWTVAIHLTILLTLNQTRNTKKLAPASKIIETTKVYYSRQKESLVQKKPIPKPQALPKAKTTLAKKTPKPQTTKKAVKKPPVKKNVVKTVTAKTAPTLKTKQPTPIKKTSPSLNSAQKIGLNPSSPFTFSKESIDFLKQELILPKKGSVKVTITIQTNGTIATIDIIEGQENKENADYLVAKLKSLKIAGFTSNKQETVCITFSHSNI